MASDAITAAKGLFTAYHEAMTRLEQGLGTGFSAAVDMMLNTAGHVVVCGMGKSGLVGRKIAATLASTGTPSLFLHPAEAIHGDLGMVRRGDVVLLMSHSGETEEIIRLLPALKRLETRIIAFTSNANSTMAREAEIALDISVDREACPLNLAPTTSSLNTLVLGDALAVALMEKRGFEAADFAATHPGGALGRRLLTHVRDRMRVDNLPFVDADSSVQDALMTMTEGRLGLTLVGTPEKLDGILTDGDLRRLLVSGADLAGARVGDVASADPLSIAPDAMMNEAEEKMLEARIQCLVVKDDQAVVVGILQIFE
ncbi:KpsF/GutQ family sugar-phosphate isomerase [Candidatus Puniceispirillum marinum]|uniref:KpsF/GutQ family protein n=1 Tax=Puniceispirillum marinum (strain IMCC1322) TaxID=488538 RepID=D5BNK3_PUNMI|nr:KpsF/GutQ family sugar-phosphate isomerase [Candidatus Puniceispirillum marinum]ADE38270.1 KpsF/GutQ family protein [Candidatus Puniceispirillum marinum IMCC1322]